MGEGALLQVAMGAWSQQGWRCGWPGRIVLLVGSRERLAVRCLGFLFWIPSSSQRHFLPVYMWYPEERTGCRASLGDQPVICLHLCETLHPLSLHSSLLLPVVRRGTTALHSLLSAQLGHQALCQRGCSQSKASSHPLLLWGQDSAW